jgi:hypothetical protein
LPPTAMRQYYSRCLLMLMLELLHRCIPCRCT